MGAREVWVAVLLAAAAGVAGLGPPLWETAPPAGAFTASINIDDKSKPDPNGDGVFNPSVITVNVGNKVLWTNKTSMNHTVTSDEGSVAFDSGDLKGPGGQFEWRFTAAGTYTYHCTHHPKMVGRVEVVDPSTTTTAPPAPTTTTTPPAPTTTTTTAAPASTTTAPPPAPTTTTTTAAPASTTTAPPAPTTTTTTAAPASTTTALPTTTTAPREASSSGPPPAPSTTTTLAPPTTTTAAVPPTSETSAPPVLAGGVEGGAPSSSPTAPPTTGQRPGDKHQTAARPPASPAGKLNVTAVVLVSALVAVGAFGVWTLIRVRPGRV